MEAKQLNIVIVNDFSNINGGAAKIAADTAIGLSKTGHNVYYFCAAGSTDPSLLEAPLKSIIHLNQEEILFAKNKVSALLRGIWNFKAYRKLKELLLQLDQENTIVHFHGWTKALSVSVMVAALKSSCRTVVTLHDFFIYCPNGGFYNYPAQEICSRKPLSISCLKTNCDSRSFSYKLYRVARALLQRFALSFFKTKLHFISLSKLSESVLNPYINKFSSTQAVENPVDVFRMPRVEVECNKGSIFIGRLSSEKGVEYFCQALDLLNYTDAVIVGEGVNMEHLKTKYPHLNFTGWQNKSQINILLKKARFLVFPSVWYETYGLVVQEAAAHGVPCIVSDCTAAAELINHDDNGLLFKAKDIADLAGCIEKLTTNDRFLKSLSEAAYNKFWGIDHSVEKYAHDLASAYSNILNN